MTDPNFKPFSEYRHKDYVIPRSMKEAYGSEQVLDTDDAKVIIYVDQYVVLLFVAVVFFIPAAVTAFLLWT